LEGVARWLGGMMDGEGTWPALAQSESHNPLLCNAIETNAMALGFDLTHYKPRHKFFFNGGRQTAVDFLNWCQPVKRDRIEKVILTSKFITPEAIVSIVPDGEDEAIGMTTTTGNYVAWGLCSKNCKPKHTPWGWQFNGSSREGELHRILLQECMIRRLKKEVAPELPDKIRRPVLLKLKSYAEYHRAETDFLNWLKEKSLVRAKRAKKSQALTKVGYLLRLVAQLKLPLTVQWIEDFFEANPGKKLVGFSMHTAVIDHLKQKFGNRCVIIDGRVTGRKRVETVRLFQSNRKVDLLIGQWTAAGVGITLTASHNFVALDFPWTPGDLVQGEDRIHRIGQKKDCYVHYLAVLGTIEERLIKILRKKAKVLDAILNGVKGTSHELNIFDILLTEMKQI